MIEVFIVAAVAGSLMAGRIGFNYIEFRKDAAELGFKLGRWGTTLERHGDDFVARIHLMEATLTIINRGRTYPIEINSAETKGLTAWFREGCGDPDIDKAYDLQGEQSLILAYLSPEVRALLLKDGAKVRVERQRLLLKISAFSWLDRAFQAAMTIHQQFTSTETLSSRQMHNATHDPLPEVRYLNLQATLTGSSLSQDQREQLKICLRDSDERLVELAALRLGSDSVPGLVERLNESYGRQVPKIIEWISRFGGSDALKQLRMCLQNPDHSYWAAIHLATRRDTASLNQILSILDGISQKNQAVELVQVLAKWELPQLEPGFGKMLADSQLDDEIRLAAADALEISGSTASLETLMRVEDGRPSRKLKRAVKRAIDAIRQRREGHSDTGLISRAGPDHDGAISLDSTN